MATAKKRVQIVVANMVRASVAGYVFAIAGYALPLDALLPVVSPAHHGQIRYRSLLAAAVSQSWADLGRFYWAQKYQRSALSLAVKSRIRRVVS